MVIFLQRTLTSLVHAHAGRTQSVQPRALSLDEKKAVLEILNSDEYADKAPAQIDQSLLQEGRYLCSISTMHR